MWAVPVQRARLKRSATLSKTLNIRKFDKMVERLKSAKWIQSARI